jgi:hypothetical protein
MAQSFADYSALKSALDALGPEDILQAVELTPALAEDILNHDPVNRGVRASNVKKLQREIEGGHWDPRKSPFMRFDARGRLTDGQHRCRAVIAAQRGITIHVVGLGDTIGLDQGAGRSLADQLQIHEAIDRAESDLVAIVTKAICRIPAATDREQIEVFRGQRDFVLECVRKPAVWLADKELSVAAVMKPSLLAVTRAQEILLHEQPAAEVDELLEDMVNGGDNAPAGSPRRQIAKQIWDAMQNAHVKKGARLKDVLKWVTAGLKYKREGTTKSVLLARFPGKGGRKAPRRSASVDVPQMVLTSA